MGSKRIAAAIAGAVALVAAVIVAPVASSAVYPNQPDATRFNNGPNGWTGGAVFDGLCIPPLTCPDVDNHWVSTGGTQGADDGYLRTRLSGLTGVASRSTGIWQSPTFTYNGHGGGVKPSKVVVALTRKSDVSELLNLAGNSVDFTLEVVRSNGLVVARPYTRVPLTDTDNWVNLPKVDIGNETLKVGSKYVIRITTRFTTGVDVIEDAIADYDNVSIRTIAP